jgi:hypothetical protein
MIRNGSFLAELKKGQNSPLNDDLIVASGGRKRGGTRTTFVLRSHINALSLHMGVGYSKKGGLLSGINTAKLIFVFGPFILARTSPDKVQVS